MSLIWLADQTQTAAAKTALDSYAATHPEVKAVLPGSIFGSPAADGRTPDFIVQLNPGFVYVGNTANTRKRGEHGNVYNIDDTAVPLILSGGLPTWEQGLVITDLVNTTQVAPTVLANLGLNYSGLAGVQLEGTRVLPVPEPTTIATLLAGLGILGLVRRKRT